MIVVGVDPHMQTHTAVAVEAASGRAVAELTLAADRKAAASVMAWARSLAGDGEDVVLAVEHCRHVTGSLERGLLAGGARVVRVAPSGAMAARRSGRQRGKSDVIDAEAVARAYLRAPERCARPQPVEPWRALKLLVDRRDQLICERRREQTRLRWLLHDLGVGADVPPGGLQRRCWQLRLAGRLRRQPESMTVVIARDLLSRIGTLSRRIDALEQQITPLALSAAPRLVALAGCGPLTAAKLIGELADLTRFDNDAQVAAAAGVAPLDASSGRQRRHRLNRGGNRQLNCALHRIAITQARWHPPAQTYLARRRAEGKTGREAIRCLKRHLARAVFNLVKERTITTAP